MRCIIITDHLHKTGLQTLENAGIGVDYQPGISRSELLGEIDQYTGVVVRSRMTIDRTFLDQAPHLKFVARAGSGMDNVDVACAKEKGVRCINTPEGNRNAVGEHTLGLLLSLLNNIHKADREVRQGTWEREANRGVELDGQTVGIIGYGNTGQAFARKLSGFDVEILAYDKYKSGFGDSTVNEVDLQAIFQKSDVVSFHIPLTKETQGWVGQTFLNHFERSVILINTSRGAIVHTTDLLACLESGQLIGAALDVLENENLSGFSKSDKKWFDRLVELDNVILTPHIAGWSHQSDKKIADILAQKIITVMTEDR